MHKTRLIGAYRTGQKNTQSKRSSKVKNQTASKCKKGSIAPWWLTILSILLMIAAAPSAEAGIMMVPKGTGTGPVAIAGGWQLHDVDSDGIIDVAVGNGFACNYFASSRLWSPEQGLKNMPCSRTTERAETSLTRGMLKTRKPKPEELQRTFQRAMKTSTIASNSR